MTVGSALKRAALALILFVAVYAPAFGLVAWLHPRVQVTIPLIIVVSAGLAALTIALVADSTKGRAEFGVARSAAPYVVVAVLVGVVLGGALAYLARLYPGRAPLDVSKLQPWMIFVYLIVAAPVQEELIFRGLLQTMIARAVSAPAAFWAVHFPVAFVALLFAAVHLKFGIVVAGGALALGLIAGELRRMSGSLVPAVVLHALLNAASSLWPAS